MVFQITTLFLSIIFLCIQLTAVRSFALFGTNPVTARCCLIRKTYVPIKKLTILAAPDDKQTEADESVKKIGLEASLLQAATNKDSKVRPQDLLAKYGVAYLVTSISLAIVSYALCYILVATGIDVGSLLEKIGIASSSTSMSTGTAAIAYAVHKAASPIRFPPTVALTPVVAGWLGKKPKENPDNMSD